MTWNSRLSRLLASFILLLFVLLFINRRAWLPRWLGGSSHDENIAAPIMPAEPPIQPVRSLAEFQDTFLVLLDTGVAAVISARCAVLLNSTGRTQGSWPP